MGIDIMLKIMKEEMDEITVREMAKIVHYLDNDLDEKGNTILDEFPYKVELSPPFADKKYDGCLDWLENNIKEGDFLREWVTRVYFKDEVDAVAFKLRWQ